MDIPKKLTLSLILLISLSMLTSCTRKGTKYSVFNESKKENIETLKHVTETLVPPPLLPKFNQVAQGEPEVVQVKLTIEEKKKEITPGVFTWWFTYNGTVPAPIIFVHQYDYVEVTLVSPSTNTLVHNIDFHAATGDMGGSEISYVAPGQQVIFRFKAIKAGVFVYHCAPGGIMVPLHILSGMNGAIMVLPREGLRDENGNPIHFDKAYYIAEQDYYLPKDNNGKFKDYPTPAAELGDMTESIKSMIPSHIYFNGSDGALLGANALTANVGEKVLFITSSANRDTRIHIVGGHADLFWPDGSFANKPFTDFETWPVPGGSAVAALYLFREPGTYMFTDHNVIEAFAYGARAEIEVKGTWNDDLMTTVKKAGPIE